MIKEGHYIKKYIPIVLFCFTLILSACGEEDTQEYSGIIGEGKAMGYEYTVTKEGSSFSWKVRSSKKIQPLSKKVSTTKKN